MSQKNSLTAAEKYTAARHQIRTHIASLPEDARRDIADGKWDEVSTDALYAACGAEDQDDMRVAKYTAVTEAIMSL